MTDASSMPTDPLLATEELLARQTCRRCSGYGCGRCHDPHCRGRGCQACAVDCEPTATKIDPAVERLLRAIADELRAARARLHRIAGVSLVERPLDEDEFHAIRARWATGPEQYQHDADRLISAVLDLRAKLTAALRRGETLRESTDDCTPEEVDAATSLLGSLRFYPSSRVRKNSFHESFHEDDVRAVIAFARARSG